MSEIQFEYFKEALFFFEKVQWLYNMPVTKILCKGSLDALPIDWLESLMKMDNDELNDFVTEFKINRDVPESLICFIEDCKKLNKLPNSNISLCTQQLPGLFMKKLSVKKQHEIFHLAKFVHEQCLLQKISLIVDLGSGLGYICQLLNHLYGYKVLGLESNAQNVETAKDRQKNIFPDSISSVKYVCGTISKNSSTYIELTVQDQFKDADNICLIGLHACGDLSAHMSKIYLELKKAKLLILVSCCYHKLSFKNQENNSENDDKEYFNYFPFSETLKKAVSSENIDSGQFFRRPFLRLACQETSDRWLKMTEKTHDDHSFYVLARAVLELYSVKNDLCLKKLVRKGTRKSQCTNFDSYLKDCIQRYVYEKKNENNLVDELVWDDKIKNDLMDLWTNNASKQKNIEIYTALQLLLQHTAESLVLTDRLHFLREHNVEANIIPIMNRSLSPRSYAVISNKK